MDKIDKNKTYLNLSVVDGGQQKSLEKGQSPQIY